MNLLPGFGGSSPSLPAPAFVAPERDSAEAKSAARRQRIAAARRKGRRASILADTDEDNLGVINRPQAQAAVITQPTKTKFGD